MCGRFELTATQQQIIDAFCLDAAPPMPAAGEQRPGDRVLAVDGLTGGPRAQRLGWGLRVDWAPKLLINARAETLETKMTFRPLLQRRCLVPVSAYFEWQQGDPARHKMRIRPAGATLGALAGLIGADGETLTLITCPPAPAIADIHDRMPVFINGDQRHRWLDPELPFAKVRPLLAPYAGELSVEATADAAPPGAARQPQLF